MMIKDLEISKELSGKELSTVRGGAANVGLQGGVFGAQPGLNFFSPQFIVNTPTLNQIAIDLPITVGVFTGSIVN